MCEELIGKEVVATALNGIGAKSVQGILGKFSYPCADVKDSYYVVVDAGLETERHIEIDADTIDLVPMAAVVNEQFLCFNEQEAALLQELVMVAVPSWNVGVYLNFVTHEMGDEGVKFLQKLDLIGKEVQ